MALVGYARVSTREERQVLDRQIDALTSAGCEKIFDDRLSGVQADRPGLSACLTYLRAGDVLTVLDLDRLGRRARDLIGMIEDLEKKGVAFKALNSPMDTTTPAGRAFLQIQAAFAEMERNLIRQRVNEGLAAARARPSGGPPTGHDSRTIALCPTLDGRQDQDDPSDLPRAGRYSLKHALSLPTR